MPLYFSTALRLLAVWRSEVFLIELNPNHSDLNLRMNREAVELGQWKIIDSFYCKASPEFLKVVFGTALKLSPSKYVISVRLPNKKDIYLTHSTHRNGQ